MSALIEEWKSSGLSQQQFCHQHGIKRPTFAYWRKKSKDLLPSSPSSSRFQEILPPAGNSVEIRYPNGVVVCLPEVDVDALKILIQLF
jgi:hypothetical protein